MSIINCFVPACNQEIKVSCTCTSPPTYSCKKHFIKHCQSNDKPHNPIKMFSKPAEGTKEAILIFLTEQKLKTDAIKVKTLSSFYQTLSTLEKIFKEILKEIDSDSTKINNYFNKVWKIKKLSEFEKDPFLSLLALKPYEAIENVKTIFTKNNNIELFNNMEILISEVISDFIEEKSEIIQSDKLENASLNFEKEPKYMQETLNKYKQAIRNNQNNAGAYNQIGNIFYHEKRYEEALKYYNDAIRINPNKAVYYTNKGLALKESGKKVQAIKCYKQAIKNDVNKEEHSAHNEMGLIFYEKKKYEGAVNYYNDAISINPNIAVYYINKGDALRELGWKWEAIQCYKKAISVNPNNSDAYNFIGDIFYNEMRYEEAKNYYNDAILSNPKCALFYRNKGNALRGLGRNDEAMECFIEACKIDNSSNLPF